MKALNYINYFQEKLSERHKEKMRQKIYCKICEKVIKEKDPLYAVWINLPPKLPLIKINDEIGPLCKDCHFCLVVVGLID